MEPKNSPLEWPNLVACQASAELIPKALRMVARQVAYESCETLFRVGDPVQHLYLVITGEVRLIRWDRNGGEIILQRSRGGFIAEASLDTLAYHCEAVAAQPTTLMVFPVAAFRAALEEDALFRRGWQSLLAKEVRKLRAQCERLSLHNAANRILHYIESEGTLGMLELNQSRKSWAAELGLTHEALYRALRRMQDDGTLHIEVNRFFSRPQA